MRRGLTACLMFVITTVAPGRRSWAQDAAEVATLPPQPAAPNPRRVWREVGHGLRHGPSFELIEVGGGDGRLILIGDDQGYIYWSRNGGESWSESRLTADEDMIFPIPLPRLDEVVLPNLDLFDQVPTVRAPGVEPPAIRPDDDESLAGAHGGAGAGGGAGSEGLQPRDRSEDPGDLLAAFSHGDDDASTWINWITTCDTDDDRAYAATDEGLYRTNDAGLTWYRIFVGANDYENAVLSVLCDDTDADKVYIGTKVGFFSSMDGGTSWMRPRSFSGGNSTCYIELDSAHEGRILIGTYAGAYSTTDLEEFETVYFPENGSAASRWVCAIASTERHLYLGSGDGAVVSHDGGETFEQMAPELLNRTSIGMMQADPRDDAHLYILTEDALWETRDAGRTVEPLLMRSATDVLTTFALDPNDPDRVLLLSGKQLLVLEPTRPPAPAPASDPLARAAQRALLTSPPAAELLDDVLVRMRLDGPTVVGLREAARRRNLWPQVSVVGGLVTALGDRSLAGLGTIGLADGVYDSASCRLAIRPPSCWIAGQARDLGVTDQSEPFVWGVAVLLRWNLPLAFFDRAETNSIWADVTSIRQDVMQTVGDYWFERQRVLTELAESAHPPEETRALSLRAAEMTAALDAMSGGMLTRPRSTRLRGGDEP